MVLEWIRRWLGQTRRGFRNVAWTRLIMGESERCHIEVQSTWPMKRIEAVELYIADLNVADSESTITTITT